MKTLNATYSIIDLNNNVFKGEDGRGIVSSTDYFLVDPQNTGITISDPRWVTTPPEMSETDKYLWQKNETIYSDSPNPVVSLPKVIGAYGDKGADGKPGAPGAPGKDGTAIEILTDQDKNEVIQYYNRDGKLNDINPREIVFKIGAQNYKGAADYTFFNIKSILITFIPNGVKSESQEPLSNLNQVIYDSQNPADAALSDVELSNSIGEVTHDYFAKYNGEDYSFSLNLQLPLYKGLELITPVDTEVQAPKLDSIYSVLSSTQGGAFKFDFVVSLENEGAVVETKVTTYFDLRGAIKADILQFILNDSSLDLAIKDGGLVFNENGLIIRNGGFSIEDSTGKELLSYRKDSDQLYIQGNGVFTGNIYANSGYFKGNLNSNTALLNSVNIQNVLKAGRVYIARSKLENIQSPYKYTVTLSDEQKNLTFRTYDNNIVSLKEGNNLYLNPLEYTQWTGANKGVIIIPAVLGEDDGVSVVTGQFGYVEWSTEFSGEVTQLGKYSWTAPDTYTGIYSENYVPNEDGFLLQEDGHIFANNIDLGDSARIANKISMMSTNKDGTTSYSNICNPSYKPNDTDPGNDGTFLEVIKNGTSTFKVTDNGFMNIGNLYFNGSESSIYSPKDDGSNHWAIYRDEAIFNNLTASGRIKTAFFEKGSIQSVGSRFLFKNAENIDHVVTTMQGTDPVGDIYIKSSRDKELNLQEDFPIGNYIVLSNKAQGELRKFKVIKNDEGFVRVKLGTGDLNFAKEAAILFNYGTPNDWVIGINATSSPLPGLNANAITVSSFNDDGVSRLNLKNEILLGEIPEGTMGNESKVNGLYASNVFLTGALTTQYLASTNKTNYAGINTLTGATFSKQGLDIPDTSRIVVWAGAKDVSAKAIQESFFQVTEEGTLYAQKGLFEGSIITKAKISASSIETALINGSGDKPALTIRDAEKGIVFEGGNNIEYFSLSNNSLNVSVPFGINNSTMTFYRVDKTPSTIIDSNGIKTPKIESQEFVLDNLRVNGIYSKKTNTAYINMSDTSGIRMMTDLNIVSNMRLGENISYVKNGDYYDIYVD